MGTYQWKPFTLLVSAEEVKGNEMKIEAGKYYKTRDGRKVGPAVFRNSLHNIWAWYVGDEALRRNDGTVGGNGAFSDSFDLISEWQDEPSPIRTVTRREIVAGVYGRVVIGENGSILLPQRIYTAEELREAAHILNQIAEVLQENGE